MFGIQNSSYDKDARVWSGMPRKPLYDFNASIGAIIQRNLRNYPTNVCQVILCKLYNKELRLYNNLCVLLDQSRGWYTHNE